MRVTEVTVQTAESLIGDSKALSPIAKNEFDLSAWMKGDIPTLEVSALKQLPLRSALKTSMPNIDEKEALE